MPMHGRTCLGLSIVVSKERSMEASRVAWLVLNRLRECWQLRHISSRRWINTSEDTGEFQKSCRIRFGPVLFGRKGCAHTPVLHEAPLYSCGCDVQLFAHCHPGFCSPSHLGRSERWRFTGGCFVLLCAAQNVGVKFRFEPAERVRTTHCCCAPPNRNQQHGALLVAVPAPLRLAQWQ